MDIDHARAAMAWDAKIEARIAALEAGREAANGWMQAHDITELAHETEHGQVVTNLRATQAHVARLDAALRLLLRGTRDVMVHKPPETDEERARIDSIYRWLDAASKG